VFIPTFFDFARAIDKMKTEETLSLFFLVLTGLRWEEAKSLSIEDFVDRLYVTDVFLPKTKTRREIVCITSQFREYASKGNWKNIVNDRRRLGEKLKKACGELNLQGADCACVHTARHVFISRRTKYQNSLFINQTALSIGHSDARTTAGYLKSNPMSELEIFQKHFWLDLPITEEKLGIQKGEKDKIKEEMKVEDEKES